MSRDHPHNQEEHERLFNVYGGISTAYQDIHERTSLRELFVEGGRLNIYQVLVVAVPGCYW